MSDREVVYYLARGKPWEFPTLVDGGHDSPDGVATAAKLMRGIFDEDGPWVMVAVHPLPTTNPPLSDGAMQDCRRILQRKGLVDS